MNFKPLVVAAALAGAAMAASAEDFDESVTLVPNATVEGSLSAGWGVTHTLAGMFTDTFTFTGAGLPNPALADATLVSIAFVDSHEIDFTSVSLNGQSFLLSSAGAVELATLAPSVVAGPLVMTVMGIAGPSLAQGSAVTASYAGTMNVTAVPEPGTTALLLAGLGTVGVLGRRRLKA